MQPEIGLKVAARVIQKDKIHTLLEPGEMGAMLDWKVTDPKTGKVTVEGSKKSESFVQQFIELLMVIAAGRETYGAMHTYGITTSIRDTANTLRNVYYSNSAGGYHFDTYAGAAVVTHGIIIGTGNTAPVISNYVIETIIPHATMNYGACTYGAPAADATTSQCTITRNFANVSGGGVTVNEAALYCRAYDGAARYFMIIRDVIVGGILVPNGQTLTLNYRPQVVV